MAKTLDLSLYLVLDPVLCHGIDGMVKTVQIVVANGVTVVQLRAENQFHHRQWYQAALALKAALSHTPVPLIINDYVDVALAADADGVHIGQADLPAQVVRQLIGADKWLGLSISNQQQLDEVPWSVIDYLGIGPIFPTTSKKNAAPALGIEQLAKLMTQRQCPAVAIGGINETNIEGVIQTGINGVAVVSAICGQVNIQQATAQLVKQIGQVKNKGMTL
ncbi:thiamine-phosphate pyrophosphorylase [Orbus hercynius]|uniref:Thiamine-phosphate synthase n=1 Tax=Orbus hercynius TaxID=593135 RepID=A0A495RBA3_9GAMM|nr:thiamine phosphate synthase [Orbus hercynius]RKS84767.1 thiamine-phosphate pyrophosphorylase [Orbus hercynius]